MPITLKNNQGQLFDYDDPAKAQGDIDNLGYAQATPDEVAQYDQQKKDREQHGTASEQALAMGELALSAGSFGLLESQSPEAKARREQLRKQSPFLAMGAEMAGAAVPGALTGGLGEAAGLGELAGGLGTAARTGARVGADFASGLSLEAEQAKEQARDISVGNVAMWTLGGVAAESLVRSGVNAVRGWQNNVVPRALSDATAYRSGEAFGQSEKVLSKADKVAVAEHWDESVNAVRTLAQESGESFLQSFDEAHGIWNKPEDVRGIIESNPEAQQKFFEQHSEAAAKLADYLDATGKPRTAATIRQHINAMNAAQDEAELFIAGDQLKRSVQKFRKRAMIAASTSGNDPFNELAAHFDDVERPLRGDLEKTRIWGENAAGKQAEENAAWSGKDGFIHNAAEFQRQFFASDAQAFDYDGARNMHWNDDAFVSFLGKDKIGQRRILAAGDKMLDKAEELTKIKEAAGIRPEDLVQLKQDVQDIRNVVDQVRTLTEVKSDKAIFDRVQAKAHGTNPARDAVLGALSMVPGPGHFAAKKLDQFWLPEPKFSPLLDRAGAKRVIEERLGNIGKANAAQAPIPSLDGALRSSAAEPGGAAPRAPESPVNLTGKTAEDLHALPLDGEAVNGGLSDRQRVDALKANPEFAKTGRVSSNDGKQGITVVQDGSAGNLHLRDGRHRFQAAKELGRDTVWGRVVDGKTGKEVFQGEIPINRPPAAASAAPGAAPGTRFDQFGNVRRAAELTAQELNDRDLDQLSEHGRAYVDRQAALFASSGPREAPLPPAAARFSEGYPSLTDAYNARLGWLREAALNPRSLVQKLSTSFGALPDTHPLMFSGLAAATSRATAYLQANMPPAVALSLAHPNGTPASRDQMTEFARLWDAVWTPQNAIRDLATGRATPSQLQAVAAVHPEVFRDLQVKAVKHLSARTKPALYETQRYLDQLLKLDGAANPALSWQVAKSLSAAMRAAPPGGPNIKPTPTQRNVGPTNPRGIASISSGPTFGGT